MAIVGGGPAGAAAALYAARAGLSTLVLDKGLKSGALGSAKKIANYPGIPEVLTGAEFMERLWAHAAQYGAEIVKQRVARCSLAGAEKVLRTTDGVEVRARTVILSSGAMGRASHVPGEVELVGKGVAYCATREDPFFRDADVFVYGGMEEAAEQVLLIAEFAATVHYAYPRRELEVDPALAARIEAAANVRRLPRHRLLGVSGEDRVTEVLVRTDTREEIALPVDAVFVFTMGDRPVIEYLDGQVALTPEGHVEVDAAMQTSVEGVFACGDITANEALQAVVCAGQGCVAALSAEKYLRGRQRMIRDYD